MMVRRAVMRTHLRAMYCSISKKYNFCSLIGSKTKGEFGNLQPPPPPHIELNNLKKTEMNPHK